MSTAERVTVAAVVLWPLGILIVPSDLQQLYVTLPILLLFGTLAVVHGVARVLRALRL